MQEPLDNELDRFDVLPISDSLQQEFEDNIRLVGSISNRLDYSYSRDETDVDDESEYDNYVDSLARKHHNQLY